ncbi:exo-alpha-sialidase [Brachybacterium hainanense]|uniref:exo-alpha-sialidase n=1 Tax=Brachybacterium hainanense TaxID=1541174 RepID=A0ABV6R9Q8_9MICO
MSSRPSAPSTPLPGIRCSTVLTPADVGAAAVRIPALLRCTDGQVLAFAEARRDGPGDTGEIHVVGRSLPPGTAAARMAAQAPGIPAPPASTPEESRGWSGPTILAQAAGRTMGNPAPVEAADGSILLLTTSNAASAHEEEIRARAVPEAEGRRVHVTRLGPDLCRIGATSEITAAVKDPAWGWYATGPGHGVRREDGTLVIAANHSRPDGRYAAHGLVSDDDGHSWRIGWITEDVAGARGPNESSLSLLPGEGGTDRLLVTCRNEERGDASRRIIGSLDRLPSHAPLRAGPLFAPLSGFPGPRIQCGLVATPGLEGVEALLTSPARAGSRTDLTLFAIAHGRCTELGLLLAGPAGYSDLALDGPDLLVLVECGDERTHERIALLRVPLTTIAAAAAAHLGAGPGGAPHHGKEQTA